MRSCRSSALRILLGFSIGLAGSTAALAQTGAVEMLSEKTEADSTAACPDGRCPDDAADGHKPETEDVIDFGEVLQTDEIVDSWQSQIADLLRGHGLNDSTSMKALGSVGLLIVGVLLVFLVEKSVKMLFIRLQKLRWVGNVNEGRMVFYHRAIGSLVWILAGLVFAIAMLSLWTAPSSLNSIKQFIAKALGTMMSVSALVLVAIFIFELISSLLESYFHRLSPNGSSRMNTILPIARNIVYGALITIFAITLISELGINVMPLLAGAGVIGFAVGFASQALVKDLLTGIVIIIEDLIQVGDVVRLGDRSGKIEKITIRKVQLRDLGGTVYTVPFSEISIVENMTKEFSYALLDIGVAYREDSDKVVELLQGIGSEMHDEENFQGVILEDLEVLGVDALDDSAVVVRVRFKTFPGGQWQVKREFLRRVKHCFDRNSIEIPFPHQTLYFGEDKDGDAPVAHIEVLRKTNQGNSQGNTHEKAVKKAKTSAGEERTDNDDA